MARSMTHGTQAIANIYIKDNKSYKFKKTLKKPKRNHQISDTRKIATLMIIGLK